MAAVFAYFAYQNTRKAKHIREQENIHLLLEIPRTNDKKELAAEQMFASLHGILKTKKELIAEGSVQEHMTFEMAAIDSRIRFYISIPKYLQNFVEGQVYAQYPTVQISEIEDDYASRDIKQEVIVGTELALNDSEVLPLKTFPNFEVDPLAAVTANLAKIEDEEEMWIQILARPIDDSWHTRGAKAVARIKEGNSIGGGFGFGFSWIGQGFSALFNPPEAKESTSPEISERDKNRIRAIEEKSTKLGYQVKIRIVYIGPDKPTAKLRLQAVVGSFKQFNTTNLNGFTQGAAIYGDEMLEKYRARHFSEQGSILNIEEVASVYHLPHTSVETPNIVWATSKTAEPPSTLPAVGRVAEAELSPFGATNFRGTNTQFGAKRSDRGRHMYVVGQTGVGKSGLLELLTLSDVFHGKGFAVVDPHGDYAADILKYIPAHRLEDVVYFNPADTAYPIGFNPLEVTDPSLKNHISSELVGVLKRMFESWGPRLEYILRYTILALLDYPNATMLDITRMLTERDFRNDVIKHVDDPVVKNFWTTEFASWNDKFAAEAVAPVLNKVGAFTANPMIRNIVGQPNSTINIRSIMDNRKILIVNLSRGLVGEDNAAILGALMVTKIQLAAMSRADIKDIEDREPFYLYVDEFQNFATDSFAVILSEARKYGLNLTVANQYVAQMSPIVKDAVFGNVGSLISFRVGADDAASLSKYFDPQFDAQDLIQLHNRHFVAALSIDGEKAPAFSATTLNIPPTQEDHTAFIVDHSRKLYAIEKAEVEKQVAIATTPKNPPKVHNEYSKDNSSGGSKRSRKKPSGGQGSHPSKSDSKQRSKGVNKPKQTKNAPKAASKPEHGVLGQDEEIKLR